MDESHGNYIIRPLKKIGSGGFGHVEKVELFNNAGKSCGLYARKIFSLNHPDHIDAFRRRFAREVTYQASCTHSNIAQIFLCNLHIDQPWFIMGLAESDLAHNLIKNQLSTQEKIAALTMALSGVAHIHSRGYLHRDLKPNNILRFGDGTYKVSDFGLVMNLDKAAESEILTKIALEMGTEGYMAPEIGIAKVYSKQSDIYALGVLTDILQLHTEIPELERVILKSTARRPADRYAEVKDMLGKC